VEGTDTGHENAEGMASVGVGLTVMLGHVYWFLGAEPEFAELPWPDSH
jgi:hypothetical protein